MSEEWRPVVGFERLYEVSDLGRVRSLGRVSVDSRGIRRTLHPRVMRPCLTEKGYRNLTLYGAGGRVVRGLHQIVAEAFHGPRPTPAHQVCHNDGNPDNNQARNLRWGTQSENNFDIVRHGNHHWANKTHCPADHEYTPENTYVYRGRRNCRTCDSAAGRRRRAEARRYFRDTMAELRQA